MVESDYLMAELLIRIVDKVNLDSKESNAHCMKRGMVVTIQPDGWPWSAKELANPEWEIRKYRGVAVDALTGYLVAEAGDELLDPYLQRRAFTFDLAFAVKPGAKDTDVLAAQKLVSPWTDRG